MALIDQHAPGSFCWLELLTSDQAAAKWFYSELFGWEVTDFPMGPSESYTIFKLQGRDAAAAFQLNEEMVDRGVPPHWEIYVATASVDATVEKVKQAGGRVQVAPMDVVTFGRMAVLKDPSDAAFCAWEAKSHFGIGITGVPGTLCWADLMTPEPARASEFYQKIFGWEIVPGQDGSGYLHIKNGEQYIGGIPPCGLPEKVHPHWLSYFLVENCDASTAKAQELGARLLMPAETMKNVGRWSVMMDPQGAAFALFQSLPHE